MGNCCSANEREIEKEYRLPPPKALPKNSDMQGIVAANWAWIKVKDQELFTDVECIGLERQYQKFKKAKDKEAERYFTFGYYKVDLVTMELTEFAHPRKKIQVARTKDNNKGNYKKPSHKHLAQDENGAEFKINTSIKFDGKNFAWLAHEFRKINEGRLPSLKQVFDGLHTVVTEMFLEKMENVKEENRQLVSDLTKETFDVMNALIKKKGFSKKLPLTKEILSDPNHFIVKTLIYLYSLEPPIYRVLNKASRDKDRSRVGTLGPYSDCLRTILAHAERNRADKFPPNTPFTVYRGFGMLDSEINEYRKMINNKAGINLRGFTSTTTDEETAMDFAVRGGNPDKKLKSVFVSIKIRNQHGYDGF